MTLLSRKPRLAETSDAAFLRWVGGRRRRFWLARALEVGLVVLTVIAIVHASVPPRTLKALKTEVAQLSVRNAQLSQKVNGFPVASVEGAARLAAANCTNFSDQLPPQTVSGLENQCGWDGNGVGNPTVPWYDPNPADQPAVSGGLTALPFAVAFLGSRNWDYYYVPVEQTGRHTAKVAGIGAFLATPPSFVINGCTADNSVTDVQSNPGVQAVQGLVSNAQRFNAPGTNIAVAGGDLTGATLSSPTVCQGGIVIATVNLVGPTRNAHWQEGLAFRVQPGPSGDVVSAVGINAAWRPTV